MRESLCSPLLYALFSPVEARIGVVYNKSPVDVQGTGKELAMRGGVAKIEAQISPWHFAGES
jgi:hypothetical protein